ncbi:MAG TPA: malto-oligosyltrehalose trehalohydrolase [Burkholderiaceae bacterium]|nr:malto-oligosyltrehalose trehalohydrolase [Burkholderiaceae bacterium]HMY98972.1 malto-oligosyltrehalose trehalohydrolase [Burkholderiaceae bacterium]HNB45272.1 malto-oligosyltrehalose trehalohydrolase [Burkholderiaceae bacterium]HNG79257.1 malto-oligosyltrehalose trehalohydrolase [Burkholderiaceae bacterium]
MIPVGHHIDAAGRSAWRVFAPEKRQLDVVVIDAAGHDAAVLPLQRDELGWWSGHCKRLSAGTCYWLELDGRRLPDPASRRQPQGVHGPSEVVEVEPVATPGWRGVAIDDAVIYELHVGTFTLEGTLRAAIDRFDHLQQLGITVIELLPLAAFPGERNWGYDGVALFALHAAYGDYADLRAFIEAAHARGIAVILDVVYNHFGPEGNYSGAFAPYTQAGATPWGAAINFDGAWNHGVREFFLANTRWWLEEVGFDGFRMDAVSLIFDLMPEHILRQITDLARAIGAAQGRELLMIAEHLRNNRHVTSRDGGGLGYQAQWNDDLNHALYAHLTGERAWRHYANFGSFEDIVKALRDGFVLDGTRLCHHNRHLLGSDGRLTRATEHVVHIQNHDQVGNRPHGDRLIASYGRERALLAVTAVLASPYVPMLFMGEEYGETAPFLFFEDFGDAGLVAAVKAGRAADFHFDEGHEPPDPHARRSFEASQLHWALAETPQGQAILAWYRALIDLKRRGELGPRDRAALRIEAQPDATGDSGVIRLETAQTLTLLNFSTQPQTVPLPPGWCFHLGSLDEALPADPANLPGWSARIFRRGG